MHRHRRSAAGLRRQRAVHRIPVLLIEAQTDFDRDRVRRVGDRGAHELFNEMRILHQRGPVAVARDFGDRAAHIDVKNVKIKPVCDLAGVDHIECPRQHLRLMGEQLKRHRMLARMCPEQTHCGAVMVGDRLRAHHFHGDEARSLLMAEQPERQVGDTRHRRKKDPVWNGHRPMLAGKGEW